MATRVNSNLQSGLQKRRALGTVSGKVVAAGSKMPVKQVLKPGIRSAATARVPLKDLQQNVVKKVTSETKVRKTKTAARRLLKSPTPEDEIETMDLDKLEIVEISYQDEVEKRYNDQMVKLPQGVNNIDDDENPQLCAEYAQEMYMYLRQKEAAYTVPTNYLAGSRTTGKMRTVLLDWLVDVQQQFKLLPETLYLTISIIDRFLAKDGQNVPRVKLQLVGVTAMLIASKIEEIYAPELNDFVYITDDAYTAAEVRQMELRIIRTLGFDLSDPLPLNFLRRFSKAGDVDVNQHALAKYILESMMLDYNTVGISGSLAAATSLYLSLSLLQEDAAPITWTSSLVHYTGYQAEHVLAKTELALRALQKMQSGGQYTAVRNKYSSKAMLQIAHNPTLIDKLSRL